MKAEKKRIVDEIKRKLDENTMFILADYTSMSASQMNELRSLLKGKELEFMVVKNELFKRALDDEVADALGERLTGPTAVALGAGDCAVFSKLIVDFAKKYEAPKVKAGFFDGSVVSAAQVGTIASLPPREVLLAQFISGMSGPLSGFVGTMRELLRRFVSVLDQITKQGDKE